MENNKVKRLKLHKILQDIMLKHVSDGESHVYFQPPENLKIKFPCIIYTFNQYRNDFADDNVYNTKNVYQITVVDKNPDSEIPANIGSMRYCSSSGFFVSEGLNHWNFTLYF